MNCPQCKGHGSVPCDAVPGYRHRCSYCDGSGQVPDNPATPASSGASEDVGDTAAKDGSAEDNQEFLYAVVEHLRAQQYDREVPETFNRIFSVYTEEAKAIIAANIIAELAKVAGDSYPRLLSIEVRRVRLNAGVKADATGGQE